jgi:toxin ParE1/3/4
MHEYRLTPDAEQDLFEIAVYTIETWGLEQAGVYEAALVACFRAIGRGEARSTNPISHRPELQVTRCEHHYVFSLHEENASALIVAVLNEKMDLMARLRNRLD